MAKAGTSHRTLLLVLLGGLAGLGGWNYHRNLQVEAAEPRPYRGYASADLKALRDAYGQEIETYRMRYEAATGARLKIREGGMLGDQIREFERVQNLSRASRELGARVAEREAALGAIEREEQRRARDFDALRLHARRLFTLP